MSAFRSTTSRVLLAALLLAPGTAWAGEEVSLSAVASANVGYSSNPFSEAGNGTGSGYAQIQFAPEVAFVSEKDLLTISGFAQDKRYFKDYGDVYEYNGAISYKGNPSSLIQTRLNLKYDSAIIGQNIFNPNGLNEPVLSGSDISQFGSRDRMQTAQANGDVKFTLSARDTLTVSGYYTQSRFDQAYALADYNGFGGTANYSRQFSDRLQIGVQGSVSRYAYRFVPGGDTTVYSPQLSFVDTLNSEWKLQGSIGASFIKEALSGSTTTVSGNIDLCRTTTRSDLCLSARRAVLPTGQNGSQNELISGIRYTYKVTARDSLSANVSYVKNSGILNSQVLPSAYLQTSADYRRALREKIDLIFTLKYAEILENSLNRSADYGALLGISMKLGRSHG